MIQCRDTRYFFCIICCLSCFFTGWGQPTLDPDLKKPAKYESRTLRAEKTGEKKFTVPRRFFQNTYTHYNYAFNAQTKINAVLEGAKSQHVDTFARLLPFYNYTLEATSAQRQELDSVIYKVNAGILLHDLRSDWMDNIYLLMGQAYYYRNTLDSAYFTFHYMNYAFAPKDADGYDLYIASNSNEGGSALEVSTDEKRNLVKRSLSQPPSRNDALVWMIRTQITRGQLSAAATLIETLQQDPLFPKRLEAALAEVTAYYFYSLPQYDSAAFYLEKALPSATTKNEQARWEYLLGQLYSLAGSREAAKDAFRRCLSHTLNPIMEVAAQLQASQQFDNLNEVDWKAAIAALEKMARRERYTNYRDLIYYTIARIELQRKKIPEAQAHLLKSVKYNLNNPDQKARSYFLLGDLAFDSRQYVPAKQYYDSVEANLLLEEEAQRLTARKDVLSDVVAQTLIIQRQDSLQHLADLPEAERTAILKKQLRQLRRQNGLAEEESLAQAGGPTLYPNASQVPSDLFNSYNSGDWYFYNNSLKARGFTEFRSKWGNRPNTDNWRRSTSAAALAPTAEVPVPGESGLPDATSAEPTLEKLLAELPITPEKRKISDDSIQMASYALGLALQNKLEDYAGAATTYEDLLKRFPNSENEADILYNLSICYRHLGRDGELAAILDKLQKQYPGTRQAQMASDPLAVQEADSALSRAATARYNDVYNLFIEGKFDEALAAKKEADSLFGVHQWSPQLLYIESIYWMKVRQDSIAIETLTRLHAQYPESPLAEKAVNLIDVLKRRTEIEEYLNNLQLEMPAEDSVALPAEAAPIPTVAEKVPVVEEKVLDAKAGKLPGIVKDKPGADSTRLKKEAPKLPAASLYTRHSQQPHFVAIVLEEVDPVYVNETRNAFNRYNREKYYTLPMNVIVVDLNEKVKMVAIKGLENEQAAIDYIKKAKELAPLEIIPWLKSNKYYFMPVAEDNMDLLMRSKDLPSYRSFLKEIFPDL